MCGSSRKGSRELAHVVMAACSAGADDRRDLAGAVGAFPDCNLLRGRLKSVAGASSQEPWMLVEEGA